MSAGAQFAVRPANGDVPEGRSAMAHLLHALNQPVTGLQCSLELAVSSSRHAEQYLSTLREALDLTARIRTLVEAVRELAEAEPVVPEEVAEFSIDTLLQEQISEMTPVAESRQVCFRTQIKTGLWVCADRRRCASLLFRILESILSLSQENQDLHLTAAVQNQLVKVTLSWFPGTPPRHSPFSRPELGLLLAQAEWKRAGGECVMERSDNAHTCIILIKLSPESSNPACGTAEASPSDQRTRTLEPAPPGDMK